MSVPSVWMSMRTGTSFGYFPVLMLTTVAVWTPGSLRPARPALSVNSLSIGGLGMRNRKKKLKGKKRKVMKGSQETNLLQNGPHS